LFLDAINYLEVGRTNESVILANVAFEEFVIKYLYDKAIQNFGEKKAALILKQIQGTKKLGSVLDINLNTVDKRSLKNNSDLWRKYTFIRKIRKHAVHPRITQYIY